MGRPTWVVAAFCFLFGAFSFFSVVERPRFAQIRTLDVLQLMVSGAFIGIALVALASMLRLRRIREQRQQTENSPRL